MVGRLSYWLLPVFSGAVWLGMLLGMLLGWIIDLHREHTMSMDDGQYIPYISDIGATSRFKPMFIALSAVTTASLDLSFLADRWLRHAGRLTPNGSVGQKFLGVLTIVFAICGTAGLVLLTVFDVAHHKRQHDGFLLCFLGGYVLSAIFICWEYQRLGIHHRDVRILRVSFWIKLFFVLVEVALAVVYASLTFTDHTNAGAAVEWAIAIVFAFYVFSFCIDLYPAVHTRRNRRNRRGRHAADVEKHGADNIGLSSAERSTGDGAPIGAGAPVEMAAGHDTPGVQQGQNSYYGDAYGQSAARATRTPRPNRNYNSATTAAPAAHNNGPVVGAFEENIDFPQSADGSHIAELPGDEYQPGRAY